MGILNLFFSTNPIGVWLGKKAFTIITLLALCASVWFAYSYIKDAFKQLDEQKLLISNQNEKIIELQKDAVKLKASNEITASTLSQLTFANEEINKRSIRRAASVDTKIAGIAVSTVTETQKIEEINKVYITDLNERFCILKPAECTVVP